jgi:hypothetical protein
MDKQTFIEAVKQDHARWAALLAQIDPGRMLDAGAAGTMSVKDLVAHVTWYEKEMVHVMATRTLQGSDLWDLPLDPRNRAIFEANQARSLDEVLEEAHQVHSQLLAEMDKFTDEDLLDPARIRDMPSEWIPWELIASNTYEHYQQHLGDLQSWIDDSHA